MITSYSYLENGDIAMTEWGKVMVVMGGVPELSWPDVPEFLDAAPFRWGSYLWPAETAESTKGEAFVTPYLSVPCLRASSISDGSISQV